jgi:hypothetical protein
MDITTIATTITTLIVAVLYVQRRRARLSRED